MAFIYTEEQVAIGEQARQQLEARYDGALLRSLLEARGDYDRALWQTCADNGWTGVTIPEEHGGIGLGLVELCLVAEAMGRVAAGMPFLSTSFACADAIMRHGSEAQQAAWLPRLASGELKGAFATSEPGAIVSRRPQARVTGGKLSGRKVGVTGGGAADVAVVYAADGDAADAPALFIVSLDGVRRELLDSFDNSRCAADLVFEEVSAERLGTADREAVMVLLSRLATVLAAEQTGGADRCVEIARDYANTRIAFGQPIGKFQSVKHGITEMWVLAQLGRAAAADAAYRFDSNDAGAALAAATARLNASEAYEQAAWLATQVHGGTGATWEHDLHIHYRRARSTALELGQPAIWEDRIVAALGAKGQTARQMEKAA